MSKHTDIINYRPDLKMDYVPSLDVSQSGKPNNQVNMQIEETPLSVCLEEFKEFTPSDTINSIDSVISRVKSGMDRLIGEMSKSKKGKEFLDSKGEDRDKIVSSNYDDPYGSSYIESYVELEKVNEELENLRNDYCMYTYGDDISYDKAKDIDSDFIEKITSLEAEDEIKDIGYTSLYYETMISYMLRAYAFKMEDEALPYMTDLIEDCKGMPFDGKYLQLLLNNFEKKQETLKNDIFKDDKTAYNIRVALKNAFLALQEYEDSLSAVDGSDILTNNRDLGLEIKTDMLSNLADSLLTLMHVMYYSPIAKSDTANSLRKKSDIRGYFIESL